MDTHSSLLSILYPNSRMDSTDWKTSLEKRLKTTIDDDDVQVGSRYVVRTYVDYIGQHKLVEYVFLSFFSF